MPAQVIRIGERTFVITSKAPGRPSKPDGWDEPKGPDKPNSGKVRSLSQAPRRPLCERLVQVVPCLESIAKRLSLNPSRFDTFGGTANKKAEKLFELRRDIAGFIDRLDRERLSRLVENGRGLKANHYLSKLLISLDRLSEEANRMSWLKDKQYRWVLDSIQSSCQCLFYNQGDAFVNSLGDLKLSLSTIGNHYGEFKGQLSSEYPSSVYQTIRLLVKTLQKNSVN